MGVHPQLVTADGKGLLVGSFQDSDDLRLVRIDRQTGEETLVAAVEGHDLDILGTRLPGVLPPPVYTSRRTGVQAESDNIVASLRERGVPVEYLLAEDEGHGFDNPENRTRLYRAIERHFAEHLGGRRTEDGAR